MHAVGLCDCIDHLAATRPPTLPKPQFGNMREEVKHEMSKKKTQSHDRIGLKLTQAERSRLLEGLTLLPSKFEDAVKGTPATAPVMLTLDDLDELGGYIAAEANLSIISQNGSRRGSRDSENRNLERRKSQRPKLIPTPSTSSRSRSVAQSRRSGDGFRSRTALSINSTSIFKRQWAGPTLICTSSRSKANATVIPS